MVFSHPIQLSQYLNEGLYQMHDLSFNQLFLGKSGTGKTTVAEIYGRLLKDLGFLADGSVKVVGASKLVGAAVGDTQKTVNQLFDESAGMVLVIDEAYVLGQSIYGKEALDTIVERVQEGASFVVVMCGYEDQMREMIRTCNPGLAGRFKLESAFVFDDFDDATLIEIMLSMAQKKGLVLSPEVL